MDDRAGDVYFALSVHSEQEIMFKTMIAAHEYLIDMDEKEEG